ncbi:S-adenosyl-L-methionine-dependent methyltransferase [Auricularia subglabra TFB-10046 SS5]|nr:S-adenosyl-L-methionine-dependent methyltransferase [Auricularia subglabra TFB-10046 SS5]
MTFSALRQLLKVLSEAVDALESELQPHGVDFPALNEPYDPTSRAETALGSDAAVKAAELIVAASAQLCATVRPPAMIVLEITWLFYLPAVLQFINRLHVVELLRDAGPSGMHVREIAAKSEVDDLKLAHCLRLCATFHIFREVMPDVFANNRVSSTLDSGKPYGHALADPNVKYSGTNGLAAYLELQTRLMLPAVSKLSEHFTDPRTKMSRDPTLTLLSTVHGYEGKDLYAFLESPSNAQLRQTLAWMPLSKARSTCAYNYWEGADHGTSGYDWASIEEGGLVVDVGGGIGHIMMPLYERFKHLRFEVQDLIGPCEHGTKVWQSKFPDAISSGRVRFRLPAHNFFEEQPIDDAAVFVVRDVTHNWPDDHLERLLSRLREAASPTTRLLIVDHVLPYTCAAPSTHDSIPGATLPSVPEPLLPNLGRVNAYAYLLDLCVLTMGNARERTLDELLNVASRAGWRVAEVRRVKDNLRFGHVTLALA